MPFSEFGYELGHAGDVNGDGETDLIISAKALSNTPPKVFIYLGKSENEAKMNLDYSWAVEEAEERECLNGLNCRTFGRAVGSAGDINGDGYSDIFISDYRYDASPAGGRSQSEIGYRGMVWRTSKY